jgi:hypothetical protein
MPSVRKTKPISFEAIDKVKAMAALDIYASVQNKKDGRIEANDETERKQKERIIEFERTYHQSYRDTIEEIWKWRLYIFSKGEFSLLTDIYKTYIDCISRVEKEPMKMHKYIINYIYGGQEYVDGYEWVFKGYVYDVKGFYTDSEARLLILEDFDKERRYFEKLKAKFDETSIASNVFDRPRIPENVRVEVWRRDSGKCARCGSREKLEYDHIVPISRGGSNTARNIELLCEKCNRSKSNNTV